MCDPFRKIGELQSPVCYSLKRWTSWSLAFRVTACVRRIFVSFRIGISAGVRLNYWWLELLRAGFVLGDANTLIGTCVGWACGIKALATNGQISGNRGLRCGLIAGTQTRLGALVVRAVAEDLYHY